jgi:hypothetical protein
MIRKGPFNKAADDISQRYGVPVSLDFQCAFNCVHGIEERLLIFAAMLPELKISDERMKAAATDPNLLATDLAEYDVRRALAKRHATGGRSPDNTAAQIRRWNLELTDESI